MQSLIKSKFEVIVWNLKVRFDIVTTGRPQTDGRGCGTSLFIDSSSGWFSIKSEWLPRKQTRTLRTTYIFAVTF